jgi:hypothetical protein
MYRIKCNYSKSFLYSNEPLLIKLKISKQGFLKSFGIMMRIKTE